MALRGTMPDEAKDRECMGGNRNDQAGLIAIIEDDRAIRKLLVNALIQNHVRVMSANSGTEGIDLIRKHSNEIKAIIMDMNLTDIDGFGVIDAVRPLLGGLHVIITSGQPVEGREKAFTGIRVTFVKKPYNIDDLISLVTS
jgi:DNA-binding NtrC family response regulator